MSYEEHNPYAAPLTDVRGRRGEMEFETLEYAGFWKRAVAWLIDFFALMGIGMFLGLFVALVATAGSEQIRSALQLGLQCLGLAVHICYFAGLESSKYQATLGKLAMGIKVTDLEGGRITFLNALGRLLAKILSALPLGIGFLMAGFTARKQALHDMIASTLVVRSR